MLTGCRRNEVLGAKWGEIDFKTKLWTLPGHRTKTHETRDVVLTPLVLSILSRLREAADDDAIYVFPGAGKTDHREGVRKDWDVIRKTAKLEDFRLHDLRRSFASVGVSAGLSLEQIGQLLGHATAETTRGYAWLMSESRDQAAATIAAIISGQPKAKVVSMKRRPRQNG
jgi:integrase